MRVANVFITGLLILINTSVFAASPIYGSDVQTRYARTMKIPKGKSLIYIYQRKQDDTISPTIWLNNYEIGRLLPGTFTVWQLAPGRLTLRVGGEQPTEISLTSRAGNIYFFRLTVSRNSLGTRALIEKLPATARSELRTAKLIKNPRQVTAQVSPRPKTAPPPSRVVKTEPVREKPKPLPPRARPRAQAHYVPTTGGMIFGVKLGALSLAKQDQSFATYNRRFDKSATGVFALEFDYQFRDGMSVGGELLSYKASYQSLGLTTGGDVSVTAILANAKQYYRTNSQLQPYLGIGAGIAATKVSGDVAGNTVGFAYQLLAGIEYRLPSLGVFAEARYLNAQTEDSNSQKIDMSGTGVFAGIAFHY